MRLLAPLAACVLAASLLSPPATAVQQGSQRIDPQALFASGDIYASMEQLLAQELQKRVAEADKWEVKLSRDGNDLAAIRLARVEVQGTNVRTRDGLVISQAALTLDNLRYDMEKRSIAEVGNSLFVGRFSEDAVERYVRERGASKVQHVRVRFREGRIEVDGKVDAGGVLLAVAVVGAPKLHDNTVDFEADDLSVLSLHMPRWVVRRVEKEVNPVVDLRGLKLPAKLARVAVDGDRLVAEGKLDFNGGPVTIGRPGGRGGAGRRRTE